MNVDARSRFAMARIDVLQYLALSLLLCRSLAFVVDPWARGTRATRLAATRYGPPPGDSRSAKKIGHVVPSDGAENSDHEDARLKQELQDFLEVVVAASDPTHLPSILSRNMDLVLRASAGPAGIRAVEAAMRGIQERHGDDAAGLASQALDTILTGAEAFVENAHQLDSQNKQLLGKVVRLLADKTLSDRAREGALDALLEREVDSFTPGFLRYVEGECDRIAAAPKLSPESSRLLEILRLVQARVVEELGRDMGEAAQVLGQLIGYESKSERLAVLDAGLAVRGLAFAEEMLSLAEEALDGFSRVPGGADPDLFACVNDIRDRLRFHIDKERDFQ